MRRHGGTPWRRRYRFLMSTTVNEQIQVHVAFHSMLSIMTYDYLGVQKPARVQASAGGCIVVLVCWQVLPIRLM